MRSILILMCFCVILMGCGSETSPEKPEKEKTDSGGGATAPGSSGGVVAPGVPHSSINPQGARQSADRAREDLNKAASDLQKNLDKAKGTQGD
jgi:hypothetical protein